MLRYRFALVSVVALLTTVVTGCGGGASSDRVIDEAMASLEAKIPGRDRASVRICESVVDGSAQLNTVENALDFTMAALAELEGSDDPNGMKNALMQALVGYGDALVSSDPSVYEPAVLNIATVCTDIVSGEYGQ